MFELQRIGFTSRLILGVRVYFLCIEPNLKAAMFNILKLTITVINMLSTKQQTDTHQTNATSVAGTFVAREAMFLVSHSLVVLK